MNRFILPMEINCTEENGIKTIWNVDSLKRSVGGRQKKVFDVQLLFNPDDSVNEEYAMTTDLRNPIIVTKSERTDYLILDGKHRLYKAKMIGEKEIWAYVIEQEEKHMYILDSSKAFDIEKMN